jgi:hypothetical protein
MTEKEKAVRAYYTGFETHDEKMVLSTLAEGFNFTSPNNDDHIPLDEFKKRCWPTNAFISKVNCIKMVESSNDVILLVEILTTDNKRVRNVDIFTFNEGKIQAIEVFFGPGISFPGSGK